MKKRVFTSLFALILVCVFSISPFAASSNQMINSASGVSRDFTYSVSEDLVDVDGNMFGFLTLEVTKLDEETYVCSVEDYKVYDEDNYRITRVTRDAYTGISARYEIRYQQRVPWSITGDWKTKTTYQSFDLRFHN